MIDFALSNFTKTQDFVEYLYSFHKSMVSNKVCLFYEGEVSHQLTKSFASLLEAQMGADNETANTQKKVFHVVVECLQNIRKHSDVIEGEETLVEKSKGLFMMMKDEDEYVITTGNIILKSKKPELMLFLHNINSNDKEGLKELYQAQIREGRISEKGGAGLGLIDIARKSGHPLSFHFININDDYAYFIFTSRINRE